MKTKSKQLERIFQGKLIKELKSIFPGCIIAKMDSSYIQGIPDLLILYKQMWATLEVKRKLNSSVQPNQTHYVNLMNKMSFSRFICPENKDEVLNALKKFFKVN